MFKIKHTTMTKEEFKSVKETFEKIEKLERDLYIIEKISKSCTKCIYIAGVDSRTNSEIKYFIKDKDIFDTLVNNSCKKIQLEIEELNKLVK